MKSTQNTNNIEENRLYIIFPEYKREESKRKIPYGKKLKCTK